MESLRTVLSTAEIQKVEQNKTSLPPIFLDNAQNVNTNVNLEGKPAFLTDEQWQRLGDVYRDFLAAVAGVQVMTDIDLVDYPHTCMKLRSMGLENCVRADMLMYYHDELVPLNGNASWYDIIIECDAARWECIRSYEDQPLAITEALFLVGKDIFCNLNLSYWQTRFTMTKLITYYGQANGQIPDADINNYIMAMVGRMRGCNVDTLIRNHVIAFKRGGGDLAIDVRGNKSMRKLKGLKEAAKNALQTRLSKLSSQQLADNWHVLEFVCDFFRWEDDVLPGYKPKPHDDSLHRNPGRKGVRPGKRRQPDPVIKSPARKYIQDNYDDKLLPKDADELLDSLSMLLISDGSQSLADQAGGGDEMEID